MQVGGGGEAGEEGHSARYAARAGEGDKQPAARRVEGAADHLRAAALRLRLRLRLPCRAARPCAELRAEQLRLLRGRHGRAAAQAARVGAVRGASERSRGARRVR